MADDVWVPVASLLVLHREGAEHGDFRLQDGFIALAYVVKIGRK